MYIVTQPTTIKQE